MRLTVLRHAVVAMLLAATACGTTVDTRQVQAPGPEGLDGTPPAVSSGGGGGSTGTTTVIDTTTGTAVGVGSPGVTGTTGDLTTGTGVPAPPGGPAAGPGSKAPVTIGIEYTRGSDTAAQATGAGNTSASNGDTIGAQYDALIADLNAHGGLAGHPVRPVYFVQDANSANDVSRDDESACARFFQDNHVSAVLIGGTHTTGLLSCAEKAGVAAYEWPTFLFDDDVTFATYRHYSTAGSLNLSRLSNVYVEALVQQRYFAKGAKIGLVTYEDPAYARAVQRSLRPALARHGLKLTDTVTLTPLRNLGSVAEAGPQIQSGVLRFASQGIDHVLFLTSSGLAFIWMTSAESQQYRPRYGVSSQDVPQSLALNAPAGQLAGAVGVGWFRVYDVESPQPTAAGRSCDALMRAKGLPSGPPAWPVCDHVRMFARAVDAAGSLDAGRVTGALAGLGALTSGAVLGVDYRRGRDGVSVAAPLAYLSSCACFRYTGPPYGI